MNRIERYLGSVVFNYSLLVMLVLMVIFAFFEFTNQLGDLDENYTLGKSALFTLLKVPVYGYEVFPIVLLIGTLMGLGSLANQSELTVLRVSGWSIKRILAAVLKTALIMWFVMLFVGEWIAPSSEAYAKKMKAEALNQSLSIGSKSGFWLKDNSRYIHVQRAISHEELHGVEIYQLDANELQSVIYAEKAQFENGWHFYGVTEKSFTKHSSENVPLLFVLNVEHTDKLEKSFPLFPEDLAKLDIESKYLSVLTLYEHIQFLHQNSLDASRYELAFWQKVSLPIVVIAMIAIVFPLVFGSMRQVSVGQRVFMGVLIGMGFHLVNQLIGNIAVVYSLPIWFAAVAPALVLITLSWFWVSRAE